MFWSTIVSCLGDPAGIIGSGLTSFKAFPGVAFFLHASALARAVVAGVGLR
jgi:hypothetical protein